MTEFYETFISVDWALSPSIEKLIPIINLLSWKKTESVGCYVVRSYEWLILSEIISRSAQEYYDEFVL